jgi:hypothetical protein
VVAINKTSELFSKTEKILSIDSLQEAEKITGKDYHEDEETGKLGFGIHILKTEEKRRILNEQDDVTYGCNITRYFMILSELGFLHILAEPFLGRFHETESVKNEMYHILWHPTKFILCSMETYDETRLNSSRWYYSYKPNTEEDIYYNIGGGGQWWCEKEEDKSTWIYVGNWDAREAVRHQMEKFNRYGQFVEWPEPQLLQLNSYMDWKQCTNMDFSYAVNQTNRRFNLLPEHIRKIIKGCGRD